MSFYIYRHIRLDTNTPFYVGKGHKRRAWAKQGRNSYWKAIVNKHGYEVEVIMDKLTEKEAFKKEEEFIKMYKEIGYCEANFTDGGEGLSNPSEEIREKLRNKVFTTEYRKKLSNAKKGKKFPNGYKKRNKTKECKKLNKIKKCKKLNNKIKEPILVFTTCGGFNRKYESIKQCSDVLRIPTKIINKCLNNTTRTDDSTYSYDGYIFIYKKYDIYGY